MPPRRCICGHSRRLPLCDGSHRSEKWRCAADAPATLARLFVAGPHNENIADRMAHAHQGAALHHLSGPVTAEEVVVITDGADLDLLITALKRVQGQRRRVLLIGADPALLRGAFAGWSVQSIPAVEHPVLLWKHLLAALEAPVSAPIEGPPPRIFLSHTTADEDRIQPAVAVLRRMGVSVFVCGDSIPAGVRWWDTILKELRQGDRFVLVLAQAASRSTWCAFEVGAAVATNKPIRLISLDGTLPPSFIGHIQMLDVPRAMHQRPWLNVVDTLIEALLSRPEEGSV